MSIPGNDCSRKIESIQTVTLKENQDPYRVPTRDITICHLLDVLIDSKEIDLYYYLVNQVSIINFSPELIEISSGNNKEYNSRLENIISNLVGKQTKIIISNIAGLSLKNQLIEDLNKSKIWANLTSAFPGCEILDIIHKNG